MKKCIRLLAEQYPSDAIPDQEFTAAAQEALAELDQQDAPDETCSPTDTNAGTQSPEEEEEEAEGPLEIDGAARTRTVCQLAADATQEERARLEQLHGPQAVPGSALQREIDAEREQSRTAMEQCGSQVKRSFDGSQSGTPHRGNYVSQWAAEEWEDWEARDAQSYEETQSHEWTAQEQHNWQNWYGSYEWAPSQQQEPVPTVPPLSPAADGHETGSAWLENAAGRLDDNEEAARQHQKFLCASREQDAAETTLVRNAPGVVAAARSIAT